MRRKSLLGIAVSATLGIATSALAQQPPPFNGGGTAFDPEVGVVQSGAKLDATATVSADRKYVTITPRTDNSKLLALRLFAVQQTNFGFVGGVNPGGGGAGDGAGGAGAGAGGTGAGGSGGGASALSSSPTAIANRASILNREGMFLLAPLP